MTIVSRPCMVIMCTMGRHHSCGSRAVAHSLRFAFGCGEVSKLNFLHRPTRARASLALKCLALCGRSGLTKNRTTETLPYVAEKKDSPICFFTRLTSTPRRPLPPFSQNCPCLSPLKFNQARGWRHQGKPAGQQPAADALRVYRDDAAEKRAGAHEGLP